MQQCNFSMNSAKKCEAFLIFMPGIAFKVKMFLNVFSLLCISIFNPHGLSITPSDFTCQNVTEGIRMSDR